MMMTMMKSTKHFSADPTGPAPAASDSTTTTTTTTTTTSSSRPRFQRCMACCLAAGHIVASNAAASLLPQQQQQQQHEGEQLVGDGGSSSGSRISRQSMSVIHGGAVDKRDEPVANNNNSDNNDDDDSNDEHETDGVVTVLKKLSLRKDDKVTGDKLRYQIMRAAKNPTPAVDNNGVPTDGNYTMKRFITRPKNGWVEKSVTRSNSNGSSNSSLNKSKSGGSRESNDNTPTTADDNYLEQKRSTMSLLEEQASRNAAHNAFSGVPKGFHGFVQPSGNPSSRRVSFRRPPGTMYTAFSTDGDAAVGKSLYTPLSQKRNLTQAPELYANDSVRTGVFEAIDKALLRSNRKSVVPSPELEEVAQVYADKAAKFLLAQTKEKCDWTEDDHKTEACLGDESFWRATANAGGAPFYTAAIPTDEGTVIRVDTLDSWRRAIPAGGQFTHVGIGISSVPAVGDDCEKTVYGILLMGKDRYSIMHDPNQHIKDAGRLVLPPVPRKTSSSSLYK